MRRHLRIAAPFGLTLGVALMSGLLVGDAAAQRNEGQQRGQNGQAQQDRQAPPADSFSDRAERRDQDDRLRGEARRGDGVIEQRHERFHSGGFDNRPMDPWAGYGYWNSGRVYRGYRGYAATGFTSNWGGYGSCGSHGGYYGQPQLQPAPADAARWGYGGQPQYAQHAQENIDPERTVLGIRVQDDEGARVVTVLPNSPAEEAGLREGDVIVSVNEDECKDKDALIEAITGMDRSKEVALVVKRDGEEKELSSKLTSYGEAFGDERLAQGDALPPAPPPRGRAPIAADDGQRDFRQDEGQRRTVARPPLDGNRQIEDMQREIDRLTQENQELRRQLGEQGRAPQETPPTPQGRPQAIEQTEPQPEADKASDDLESELPAAPEENAKDGDEDADAADQADDGQEDEQAPQQKEEE